MDDELTREFNSRRLTWGKGNERDLAKQQAPPLKTPTCLRISDWLARDTPPPDYLMGELLSTTSRAILAAPTGLGKTNFSMMLAASMAAGAGFLHWSGHRPSKVLYIDGEMSVRLMKAWIADVVRRFGSVPKSLSVMCRDDIDGMPPLNTPAGQHFIDQVIADQGGIDFIIFDNVQSLLLGDMKDEEPWEQTLPWIKSLTRRCIGQLWVHHTGHNETRSYGTSTREWQLDTSILLERLNRPDTDIAFTLTFKKSRERAPHNRADFEPVAITLGNDRWQFEASQAQPKGKQPSPTGKKYHGALMDALAERGEIRAKAAGRISVTMDEWRMECVRLGLLEKVPADTKPRKSQQSLFNKYRLELVTAEWVACNDDIVWNLNGFQ